MSEVFLNQEMLIELLRRGFVSEVKVSESIPSKGKALTLNRKRVWIVSIVLISGEETKMFSTRGSPREWASLDRLNEWLRISGMIKNYVVQMETNK